MGYYTRHEIETHYWSGPLEDNENYLNNILSTLSEVADYNENDLNGSSIKWYSQDTDCIEASKKHPKIMFSVTGYGEESGDIWRRVYFNGKEVLYEKWEGFSPLTSSTLMSLARNEGL